MKAVLRNLSTCEMWQVASRQHRLEAQRPVLAGHSCSCDYVRSNLLKHWLVAAL